jgi:hypothetical protein
MPPPMGRVSPLNLSRANDFRNAWNPGVLRRRRPEQFAAKP